MVCVLNAFLNITVMQYGPIYRILEMLTPLVNKPSMYTSLLFYQYLGAMEH